MDTTAPLDLLQRVQSLQDILEGKACECEMEVKVDSNCLMDSFLTLYDECQHDILARNKHVASFLKKCKLIFCFLFLLFLNAVTLIIFSLKLLHIGRFSLLSDIFYLFDVIVYFFSFFEIRHIIFSLFSCVYIYLQ